MFFSSVCIILLTVLILYDYIKSRNSRGNVILRKYTHILKKFKLHEIFDNVSFKHECVNDKMYNCEITIQYNNRTHHKYFTILDTPVAKFSDEIQPIECADLCMLLFFEQHASLVAKDIYIYRNKLYKWNVGKLSYVPKEQANIT